MKKNKNKNKNADESTSWSSEALKKVREDPRLPSHVVDALNELIEKYNNKKIEREDDVIELIEKRKNVIQYRNNNNNNKGKKPETGGSGIKNDDEAISLSLPDRVEKYLKAYMAADEKEMKFEDWLFRDFKEDEKDDICKNVAKEVEKGEKMDVTSIISALNESTLFIRKLEDQMKNNKNENSRDSSSAAKQEPNVKAKRNNRKNR